MVQKKSASGDLLFLDQDKSARPIHPVARDHLPQVVKKLSPANREWVKATGFSAKPNSQCLLPDGKGGIAQVLVGYDPAQGPFAFGDLAGALPAGAYSLASGVSTAIAHDLALGWALGAYVFDRYRKVERPAARLVWPKGVDRAEVRRLAAGTQMVRDLINTPAEDLGPEELEAAARQVAKAHGAKFKSIVGAKLLPTNYPLIHAVGRAATREPRLIDMTWGSKGPRVTLVGKGVCFDSGGLDLKSSDGMKLMKKDMGGAAHVLALADMIMSAKLPIRLRLMIPAVENMVSGNAIRPLDVIKSRGGLTVEIGNTDAEGRLILCDALAEAVTEKPALLLDFATLTGAARVALGTDLPALFCNHEATAAAFLAAGLKSHDPLWRLPLHRPYRRLLDSKVADLNSISEGGYGGAVTAALFLEAFVPDTVPWAHVDLMAWNLTGRPGRPAGGEALGLRAAYRLIEQVAAKGGPLS